MGGGYDTRDEGTRKGLVMIVAALLLAYGVVSGAIPVLWVALPVGVALAGLALTGAALVVLAATSLSALAES